MAETRHTVLEIRVETFRDNKTIAVSCLLCHRILLTVPAIYFADMAKAIGEAVIAHASEGCN